MDTAIKVAVEKESVSSSSLLSWITSFWKDSTQNAESEERKEKEQDTGTLNERSKTSYINEQAFLSLSWWLLNRGWLQFKSLVEKQISLQFNDLNPRDTLSLDEFGEKLSHVFHAVNQELFTQTESQQFLHKILLPEPNLEQFVLQQTLDPEALKLLYDDNSVLRELLNETTKCVQSTASLIVLESLVNDAFQYTMTQIDGSISKKNKSSSDEEVSKFQVALYSVTCKDCCNEMLKSGVVSMNNEFLQHLDAVAELDDLSASVYSNFGF